MLCDEPLKEPVGEVESTNATEISLAENEMREAMHPADQFEAFETLANERRGAEASRLPPNAGVAGSASSPASGSHWPRSMPPSGGSVLILVRSSVCRCCRTSCRWRWLSAWGAHAYDNGNCASGHRPSQSCIALPLSKNIKEVRVCWSKPRLFHSKPCWQQERPQRYTHVA
jgi:hypothetical protein